MAQDLGIKNDAKPNGGLSHGGYERAGVEASVSGSDIVEQAEGIVSACTHLPDCPCGCNDGIEECMFDSMPNEELLYDLADLFKVFADTTRIKILYALMGQDRCVADIAQITSATQSAVSHQLRILKQAHLVKFKRDGKNVIYSLADDHVYTMLAQGLTHICE